jgi:hypothetical protein
MALFGGVAVLAIGAAMYTLAPRDNSGGISQAGILPSSNTTTADITYGDGQVRLVIANGLRLKLNVMVTDSDSGLVIYDGLLDGVNLNNPLSNAKEDPAMLELTFGDQIDPLAVVLPGQRSAKVLSGDGTAIDMARAVAQCFQTPVLIRLKDRTIPMTWSFSPSMTSADLPASLGEQGAKLTLRSDGILVLSD